MQYIKIAEQTGPVSGWYLYLPDKPTKLFSSSDHALIAARKMRPGCVIDWEAVTDVGRAIIRLHKKQGN